MIHNSVILAFITSFWDKIVRCYACSGLCRFINIIKNFFSKIWSNSFARGFFVSDVSFSENALRQSFFARIFIKIEKCPGSGRKSRFLSESVILNGFSNVFGNIPYTSSQSFGLALLTFSITTLIFRRSGLIFYIAVVALAAGLLMLIINRSFYNIFKTSFFIKLAAGFFGFPEKICVTDRAVVKFNLFYSIAGLIFGGLAAFLELELFIFVAGGLAGGLLVLYKTEIGVLTTAFLLPIVPTKLILGLCAITALSYFSKVFFTKTATFRLTLLDLFAILFGGVLAYSVVISYRPSQSLIIALTYILYILFYIVAKNTLRTKQIIFAAISLMAVAGLFVALFGIYQRLSGNFSETAAWIDEAMFEQATARIYSTLENPNVLGEYLIFVMSIAMAMLYYFKKNIYKIAGLGLLGVSGLCMVFTQSRGAWLGFLFALAVIALMYDRKLVAVGIAGILIIPLFLPESVIMRFLSMGDVTDSSTNYRLNIWLACLKMIEDVWRSGIGLGIDSFKFVYQEYAFNAVEAPHSHNLYLQVVIDTGIFGLIVLIGLLIVFFRYLFVSFNRTKDKFIKVISVALVAGMFGYLIQGFTEYVWYNYRIVCFFWFIVALSGALYNLREESKEVFVK